MVGKHIFLSYSSKDLPFALQFAQDIRQHGILLWMDKLDGIRVGDDWVKALETAVNEAIGLVAILSPNYVQSQFCRAELARANSLNHLIFPVLLHPVLPTDVPLMLQTTQYLDFTAWQTPATYTDQLDKLVAVITDKLAITAQAPIASHVIPDDQSIASARQTEVRFDVVNDLILRANERERKFYLSRLEIELEKYEAVTDAFLSENNPSTRVLFGRQIISINKEIAKIEGELKKLLH